MYSIERIAECASLIHRLKDTTRRYLEVVRYSIGYKTLLLHNIGNNPETLSYETQKQLGAGLYEEERRSLDKEELTWDWMS